MIYKGLYTSRGILFVLICTGLLKQSTSYTVSDANKIHKFLFNSSDEGYNKLVLPDKPVNISAEYNLLALNSLNIKEQILETTGWFTVTYFRIQPDVTYHDLVVLHLKLGLLKQSTSYTVSDANKIHKFLFNSSDEGYNKLVLPDKPVNISAEYNLLALNSLNIKEQILETTGWFTVVWNDSRLTWDKSLYGEIDYIYVPEDTIWHPELIVQNSILVLRKNLGAEQTVRIQYNGEVRWEPPAVLSTSCDMDVTYFPYDSQTCEIELASWGFSTDVVNLEFFKTHINLEDYRPDEEWDLLTTFQETSNLTEDELVFSELLFRMEFKRLYGHYLMSVIFPTILTAILTFVTFFLPLESGDKIGYILTVLLALAVLLTLFSDTMPTTSKHTSVLVVFLTVTLGMACLVIIFTIFIIRLFHQPEHDKAPKWMHSLARKFLKLKCKAGKINHLDHLDQSQDIENDSPKDRRVHLKSKKQFTPYTNKELAEFFDYFLFGVFTVLYICVLLCFPIVLSTST